MEPSGPGRSPYLRTWWECKQRSIIRCCWMAARDCGVSPPKEERVRAGLGRCWALAAPEAFSSGGGEQAPPAPDRVGHVRCGDQTVRTPCTDCALLPRDCCSNHSTVKQRDRRDHAWLVLPTMRGRQGPAEKFPAQSSSMSVVCTCKKLFDQARHLALQSFDNCLLSVNALQSRRQFCRAAGGAKQSFPSTSGTAGILQKRKPF